MVTVGAFEAKTKFSELLDRVERGEEVVITRHGKVVAHMHAAPDVAAAARKAKAAQVMAEFLRVREMLRAKGVSFSVDDILSARNGGRR